MIAPANKSGYVLWWLTVAYIPKKEMHCNVFQFRSEKCKNIGINIVYQQWKIKNVGPKKPYWSSSSQNTLL